MDKKMNFQMKTASESNLVFNFNIKFISNHFNGLQTSLTNLLHEYYDASYFIKVLLFRINSKAVFACLSAYLGS